MDVFDLTDGAITEAEQDATDFLVERPDLRPIVDAVRRWCDAAVASGKKLQATSELAALALDGRAPVTIPEEHVAAFAAGDLARPFIDPAIAREGMRRAQNARRRLIELLGLLVAAPLNPPAEHYLWRVAALYIWGFDAEVLALARAVLDSALQERLPDEVVRKTVAVKGKYVTLWDRIQAAKTRGLLDPDQADLADDIRDAGNDILHHPPKPRSRISTPIDGISALRTVLHALYVA